MRLLPNRRASIHQAPVALKSVLVRQAIDALQSRMLNTGGDGYERVLLALSVIPKDLQEVRSESRHSTSTESSSQPAPNKSDAFICPVSYCLTQMCVRG